MKDEKLIYIKPICKNNDGAYEYELFFSSTPEIAWGFDWDINNPSSCEDTTPDKATYDSTERIVVTYPLKTAQETKCLSMEYAVYGILALGWIDIENLDTYPEHGRMVLHFNETKEDVQNALSVYGFEFQSKT